jgi:hypothetical protein
MDGRNLDAPDVDVHLVRLGVARAFHDATLGDDAEASRGSGAELGAQ